VATILKYYNNPTATAHLDIMNKHDDAVGGGMKAAATDNKRRPKASAKAKATLAAARSSNQKRSKHKLCKALECPKFRQGKCNGFCVACFQKNGATTCRDLNCINKVHKDGYCISHLASVVDDDNIASKLSKTEKKKKTATKPSKLEPSKPAASVVDDTIIASKPKPPESEKKRKAVIKPSKLEPSKPAASVVDDTIIASKPKPPESEKKRKAVTKPSKPAKRAKKKHRYRERFTFPATSSQKAIRIDANSRNPNQQTITKNDLQSLFDSVLKDARHAKSSDGNAHYLFDEIRENISTALESSLSSKLNGKKRSVKNEGGDEGDEVPTETEIQGISEEAFTAEEVASMPVVFAYHCEDAVSEQNAKIATLDYEVEQVRLKRKAAMCESNSSAGQAASKKKPATPDKSVSSMETTETEREPATEFPSGWTMINVPRKNGTKSRPFDTYYYSPMLRLKFRSRPEVKRFIALLGSSDNDEMKAHEKFIRMTK